MLVRTLPLLLAALLAFVPTAVHAQLRARLLASGFNRPNGVVFDPVVTGAVYVVDQAGVVRAFLNGVERPTPFLDLRTVVSTGGEQGLLGLAFPPDAATSRRVFVNFTNTSGDTVVARFTRSATDAMTVDAASRFDLRFPNGTGGVQAFIKQDFSNHNGGNLAFGPDGYLYIGMGDGGSGNDPNNRAQSPNSLLGKMLRIDVAVPANDANGYAVPATNPLFPVASALREIWAFGLRNPWRYSFDNVGPGNTGALVIADVGQGDREEINYEPSGQGGRNYGWRVYEGTRENTDVSPLPPAFLPLQAPVFEYTHQVGEAITGGYVYRGSALGAAYQGRYFYADCVRGKIFSLQLNVNASSGEATPAGNTEHTTEMGGPFRCIGSFARDTAGELYFMDFGYSSSNTGRVFKIEPGTASPPTAPSSLAASVFGNTVTLTWNAPGDGSASSYAVEAGSASGAANLGTLTATGTTLNVPSVPNGQYFVRVRSRNAAGTSAASNEVTVRVGCAGPPAAPSSFTATVNGSTVTMAWSVLVGTTTTVIDAGYTPGATAVSLSTAAPTGDLSVPAVPPNTYYVRARAVNACGSSAPSVERTIVVR